MKILRVTFVFIYFALALVPLCWLATTSFKSKGDTTSLALKWIPSGAADIPVASQRYRASLDSYRELSVPTSIAGKSFYHYLGNSLLIGLVSTFAAVALGTCCAYGFSRFRIPGARDWLFFILSTRFLPPLAVIIPIRLMYTEFELEDSHLGLIILYTCFNLSLAVWLMKGFIDEIPRAYEEAALVDGYSRGQAFLRIVLPQARTGIAVTAVFCLIAAWNEYGFAMTLNRGGAVTVPVYFAGMRGNVTGMPWHQIAAGVLLFVAPIMVFTVLARNHLLRGVSFGTIKQ